MSKRPMSDPSPSASWRLPWTGSCRCGRVGLRSTEPPLLIGVCHCSGCQKMSASAFSLSIAVPGEGFSTSGLEPEIGGLHGRAQHHFCPWCKSWMFTRVEGMNQFVNVRASMLDDHAWVVPYVEFWTSEKLPWAKTGATLSFEREPEPAAFADLIAAFAREGVRPGSG